MDRETVLVVDDDEDFADGVAEMLELAGYRAVVTHSGEEGIESCSREAYHAALIDIGLPGMNGVECLTLLKKMHPEIHVFLLTGFSASHITEQGIEAGATVILTKPVEPDDLIERISQAIG